ncbi:MAG: hypothetical protein Q9184_002874 [Pyrenodesmia sp. 2 TL-2023]
MEDDVASIRKLIEVAVMEGKDVVAAMHWAEGFLGSDVIGGPGAKARKVQGLGGGVIGIVFITGAIFPQGFEHGDLPYREVKVPTNTGQNPLPHLIQTPSGLAILEIQGTINFATPLPNYGAADNADSSSSSTAIGKIAFPDYREDDPTQGTSWMKRVHLYVGRHQRLTGEAKKLPSPLAVIRRKNSTLDVTDEVEIAEIVYYKLLFSSRPEPVGD